MRITHLALVAGAALLVSASAFAASEQMASTDADAKSEPLICRVMTHEGMVISHATECHSQRWWDRVRHDEEKAISDMQIRSASSPH